MKSKSISPQGSATLIWVCRWSSGLRSASRPVIHILAGLKVCIQAIAPITPSAALSSRAVRRIESASFSVGFQTTSTGSPASPSMRTISRDCSATWRSVSSP
jgi:hypothetical protein